MQQCLAKGQSFFTFVAFRKAWVENAIKNFQQQKIEQKYYLLWARSCIQKLVHWIMILFCGRNYK